KQCFTIRSYEVGANKTATVETMMSLLQESAVNHMSRTDGFSKDGIWTSPSMRRNSVTWVVAFIHLKIDTYPSWNDIVEIETWTRALGDRLGMHGDWLIKDQNTGSILARATSTWLMINTETRRFSKIPYEVWNEIMPFFNEESRALGEDGDPLDDIEEIVASQAEYVRSDLRAHHNDLDMNQHVNNSRYFRWLLEAVPPSVLKSHELARVTLEFKRECREAQPVRSLCRLKSQTPTGVEFVHRLLLQDRGSEILRGQTLWRPTN
ncbi:hypothetical protein SELMODRAFT_13356, partial [Selaginella moellendorffii]